MAKCRKILREGFLLIQRLLDAGQIVSKVCLTWILCLIVTTAGSCLFLCCHSPSCISLMVFVFFFGDCTPLRFRLLICIDKSLYRWAHGPMSNVIFSDASSTWPFCKAFGCPCSFCLVRLSDPWQLFMSGKSWYFPVNIHLSWPNMNVISSAKFYVSVPLPVPASASF